MSMKLRNCSVICLLMLSQLYVKCVSSAIVQERVVVLPLQNASDKKEISQPKDSCSQGVFHTKPEFFDGSIFKPPFGVILETVYGITTVAYCLYIGLIVDPVLAVISDEEFCDCDCYSSHGASDYRFCVYPDIPCLCIYTEEDRKKLPISNDNLIGGRIPESKELQVYSQLQRNNSNIRIRNRISHGTEIETQNNNEKRDGLCAPIIEASIKFDCVVIENDGKPFYTFGEHQIYPADICSIDCYLIHGARKGPGPYGQCCDVEDGIRCICMY